MTLDLNPVLQDLRTVIAGACPEVLPQNGGGAIYEAEHIDEISAGGDKDEEELLLPYVSMLADNCPKGEWAADTLSGEPVIDIVYVDRAHGPSTSIRNRLKAILAALMPDDGSDPLSTAQVLDMVDLTTSSDHPVNRMLSASNLGTRAGILSVQFLVTS